MKFFYFLNLIILLFGFINCDGDTNNKISYAFDVRPIFVNTCFSCHSDPEHSSNNLNLISYKTMMYDTSDNGPVIIPKYPEQSIIVDKMLNEQPAFGSQMPLDLMPLEYDQINKIQRWIYHGAKDN